MKKLFKLFAVAIVAVTTFVSAGCSCSLNDKKLQEKVREVESAVVYKKGNDYQDFTLKYTEYNISNGKSTKVVFDTDFSNNRYMLVKTDEDGVETPKSITTKIEEDSLLESIYGRMKKQPINAYGEMTVAKFKNLWGLEDKQDVFFNNKTVEMSAKKRLLKNEVTFVIEYNVNIVNRNRVTMKVNKENKVTEFKVEFIGQKALGNGGNYEEFVTTLVEATVEYK